MVDGSVDFSGVENEIIVCCFVRDGILVNCMIGYKVVVYGYVEGKF